MYSVLYEEDTPQNEPVERQDRPWLSMQEQAKELKTIRERVIARRKYPVIDSEGALQRSILAYWIYGQEFIKDGMRHIIGADIKYHRNKKEGRGDLLSWRKKPGYTLFQDDGREEIAYHDSRIRLENVDHVSDQIHAAREDMGIHPSEKDWARSRSHPRHLLNFPQEILNMILGYALILDEDVGCLAPHALTCNRPGLHYQEACYKIGHVIHTGTIQKKSPPFDTYRNRLFEGGQQSLKISKLSDEHGSYVQLQRILRPVVDASCLRACKIFNGIGSEILFRQNTFTFDVDKYYLRAAKRDQMRSSVLMLDREGPFSDLDATKPGRPRGSDGVKRPYKDWQLEVMEAVSQVKQRVSDRELKDWAYNDPFLRFLFVIGPKNAALIKTLQFSGTIRTHACNPARRGCKNCEVGFLHHFVVYLQFIRELCTGLETLVLNIAPDSHGHLWSNHELRWYRFQRVLTPVFEMDIRKLETVKTLVLCTPRYLTEPADRVPRYLPMSFPAAVETCQWFEDRAKGWASKKKV
ncbi:hypothetical protein NHQ30_005879 [Ciborinia camelliae]|nr:hypothetical protein NHQ30_005879 [Ciborinia camelliae]